MYFCTELLETRFAPNQFIDSYIECIEGRILMSNVPWKYDYITIYIRRLLKCAYRKSIRISHDTIIEPHMVNHNVHIDNNAQKVMLIVNALREK